MHKLVIDLEMCDSVYRNKGKAAKNLHEIIEIGAVLLDENNNELKRFQQYIKPEICRLTPKISELTGITNNQLSSASTLSKVLEELQEFLVDKENTVLCTWSNSDTTEIVKELNIKHIENKTIESMCDNYVDIQQIFQNKVNLKRNINLEKALNMVGIEFDGKAHTALDDAVNTAKLYKEIMENPDVINTITNINELMTDTDDMTIGDMIDFGAFKIEQ